jgi:hypothetical protein
MFDVPVGKLSLKLRKKVDWDQSHVCSRDVVVVLSFLIRFVGVVSKCSRVVLMVMIFIEKIGALVVRDLLDSGVYFGLSDRFWCGI